MHNYVHDNNNPNIPSAGSAAAGPVGTGMSVSGGRNDTVMDNRFVNNDAWGVIIVNYPDSGKPCTGGTYNSPLLGKKSCLFDEWGDAVLHNTFTHNGGYGNPTNGDFEQLNFESHPSDCFSGNVDTAGSLSRGLGAARDDVPHLHHDPGRAELQLPVRQRGRCATRRSMCRRSGASPEITIRFALTWSCIRCPST